MKKTPQSVNMSLLTGLFLSFLKNIFQRWLFPYFFKPLKCVVCERELLSEKKNYSFNLNFITIFGDLNLKYLFFQNLFTVNCNTGN